MMNFLKSEVAILSASIFSANFIFLSTPVVAQVSDTDINFKDLETNVFEGERLASAEEGFEVVLSSEMVISDDSTVDEVVVPSYDSASLEKSTDIAGGFDEAKELADSLELNPSIVPVSPSLPINPGSVGNNLFSDYLLGPGDQIQVDILGYEAFEWASSQRVVLSDGNIRLPLIGTIPAAGMTLEALETDVTNRLRRTLVEPVVDMSLVVLRPVVINISGDVYRPGPVQLGSLTQAQTDLAGGNSLTTTTNTPTLTAALAAAGGIRRTADIRQVVIRRRLATGQIAEYNVNLWDALRGADDLGVLVMFDGDSVFVPKATSDSGIDQALVASSSIAPTNVRVRVIGEGVVNPGEVQVQPNSSISSAVAAAGGPNADAALQNVRLIRLSESGQVEEEQVDLANFVDNYQIQDGDVVFVPKRSSLVGIDRVNRVLTPILGPLGGILGIFNLFGIFDNN